MRTLVLTLSAAFIAMQASAQNVATFEDLSLPTADTFYVNYSAPGTDVGVTEVTAHFPCDYDTAYGYSFWSSGFAYSNMDDSVTSGFANQYAAKAGKGYGGSDNYMVIYGSDNKIYLTDTTKADSVMGMYITNGTYAFNSMRDGDAFAKQFGGATGNDTDFFRLTIKGYYNGSLKSDSVDFYLADFHYTNPANHYLVNTWKWVDLSSLGRVDSLEFLLSSSDTGMYGMNTPAYFCMDNLTMNDRTLAVPNVPAPVAKVYPIPATDHLYVESADRSVKGLAIYDLSGKMIANYPVTNTRTDINTSSFAPGMYVLQLQGAQKSTTIRFVKK